MKRTSVYGQLSLILCLLVLGLGALLLLAVAWKSCVFMDMSVELSPALSYYSELL